MVFARTAFRTLRSLPSAQLAQATSRIAQARALSTEARKLIDDAVKTNPLVVFMKGTPDMPQCGFSRAVCQILDVQGVPRESLKSYNCLEDQELREGIKEYSEWPTIPQVYIKGEFVGGCDIVLSSECRTEFFILNKISFGIEIALNQVVHQSGELEKLLVKEGLIPELPQLPEDQK